MRILFMGSSEASATSLRAILRNPQLKVIGVVTQPDRPSGRNRKLTPCPCKAFAEERRLPNIFSPEKINTPESLEQIRSLKPDIIAVVAYGQFLCKELLEIPPLGCVNGHFSLLPKYRGASPVQAAIIAGEHVTGVTIMQMGEGMDDGDILMTSIEPICSDDTGSTLMDRLAILGGVTLAKALRMLADGPLPRTPQDGSLATFARKMSKNDGLLDWTQPAMVLERRIRGFDPWPGAFTYLPEKYARPNGTGRVKILQAEVLTVKPDGYDSYEPGEVCAITKRGPVVCTTGRPMLLLALQPDGGKTMDGKAFLNGRPLQPGDRFSDKPWGAQ